MATNTALIDAARRGDEQAAYRLLVAGHPINMHDCGGRYPLHAAAEMGHPAMVSWLLQHGADIGVVTHDGASVLFSAALSGDIDILNLVFDAGAQGINDRDNRGATPLHYAVTKQHTGAVRWMLAHGADPTLRDKDGKTPLDLARGKKMQASLESPSRPQTMKYFIWEWERDSSIYHKFRKGRKLKYRKWENEDVGALLIHNDDLEATGLADFLYEWLPHYDQYGDVEVKRRQWNVLMEKAYNIGGEVEVVMEELRPWAEETLRIHGVFSIMGI